MFKIVERDSLMNLCPSRQPICIHWRIRVGEAFRAIWLSPNGIKWPIWPHPKRLNQYDALIGDGRAGEEAPSCEGSVHMRTYRCTPHLTSVGLSSNWWLVTHTKFERNLPSRLRDMENGCQCERVHVQMHPTSDLCNAVVLLLMGP